MKRLTGKKILLFVEDQYEDLELWYPKIRLSEEGAECIVAGPELKVYRGKHGYPCKPETTLDAVTPHNFDGLVIPGGYAPDKLRRMSVVLSITRAIFDAGKPVAYICHAGWVPISAKIVHGKRVTSVKAIRDDMENAGGIWEDAAVVIDGNMITSRTPEDLPQFCTAIIGAFGSD